MSSQLLDHDYLVDNILKDLDRRLRQLERRLPIDRQDMNGEDACWRRESSRQYTWPSIPTRNFKSSDSVLTSLGCKRERCVGVTEC